MKGKSFPTIDEIKSEWKNEMHAIAKSAFQNALIYKGYYFEGKKLMYKYFTRKFKFNFSFEQTSYKCSYWTNYLYL